VTNKPLVLTLATVVIIAIAVGGMVLSKRTSSPQISPQPTASITDQNVEQKNSEDETAPAVPLPQEEDIIRTFFNLINEGRPGDAIAMMSEALVGNDTSKQTWGVQFNSFKSVQVNKIESSLQEDWEATSHTYKVTLDVQMKPEAQNAPIPNYGWDNGQNIRWITLEKVENLWKIAAIATGP